MESGHLGFSSVWSFASYWVFLRPQKCLYYFIALAGSFFFFFFLPRDFTLKSHSRDLDSDMVIDPITNILHTWKFQRWKLLVTLVKKKKKVAKYFSAL